MHLKAQASLEYLMTYGWALAIIVAVAAILFFVFSPSMETVSCGGSTKVFAKAGKADTEKIVLAIQNGTGGRIDGFQAFGVQACIIPWLAVCFSNFSKGGKNVPK